jgi:glycosyltransferase involved in cell wall biosynthesis
MNILYHLTILPPKMPECEAISQEIDTLRSHFGGDVIHLNPNQNSPIHIPRVLFGLHRLRQLRIREANVDVHHLYNPDPFPFPVLRALRRPVVYSLTGGVEKRLNRSFFTSLAAVTVADEGSLERLHSWGLENAVLVRPGIDAGRFVCSLLPIHSEIRLLVGSAPWTRAQFRTKGVDALLSAAHRYPQLTLIFLWRGVLTEEIKRRVRRMGLERRVEVIDQKVDVNRVLAGVHASVALATGPALIRAYPHSLIESLAAGKPVLVSRCIPMAEYVERTGCGVVIERIDPADILAAVRSLVEGYSNLQSVARQVGQRDFSQQRMIASYQEVYERVLGSTIRRSCSHN